MLIILNYNLETQKQSLNKYRLDGYIEGIQLAIEYDEGQHFIGKNKELDKIRQNEIEKDLGCTFVRCNLANSDEYNIGLVVKEILHKEKNKYE